MKWLRWQLTIVTVRRKSAINWRVQTRAILTWLSPFFWNHRYRVLKWWVQASNGTNDHGKLDKDEEQGAEPAGWGILVVCLRGLPREMGCRKKGHLLVPTVDRNSSNKNLMTAKFEDQKIIWTSDVFAQPGGWWRVWYTWMLKEK